LKAVIQRVSEASVTVGEEIVSAIGGGMLILLGVHRDDTEEDADILADKIAVLRIFNDDNGKMNLSLKEKQQNPECLVVSNFTLYGDTRKGRRPSYVHSAGAEKAEKLYHRFMDRMRKTHNITVSSGIFGAMMEVRLTNDGPVTIIIDSFALRKQP
jgi:D-tyrosyl-tRNA(Tyr) deacylase